MKNENIINAQSVVKLDKTNIRLFEQNGLVFAEYSGETRRVLLNLAFPYESRDTYVSVLDVNEDEIGIIIDLADIDNDSRAVASAEIARRYYMPEIVAIKAMKEKNGFGYWEVQTREGDVSFTVWDNFKNIVKIGADKAIIFDVAGNRFCIPELSKLDKKSRRKIELYL